MPLVKTTAFIVSGMERLGSLNKLKGYLAIMPLSHRLISSLGYLASAASCCSTENEPAWLYAMQKLIKANNTDLVIQELENHFTQHTEDSCPAFKCYNYIIKRMNQLDYKSAIEQDLPIGSGEIEGGHRSVVQKRLKLAGGWWRLENAQAMLACLL